MGLYGKGSYRNMLGSFLFKYKAHFREHYTKNIGKVGDKKKYLSLDFTKLQIIKEFNGYKFVF